MEKTDEFYMNYVLHATTVACSISTAADSDDYYMEAVICSRVANYLFHVTVITSPSLMYLAEMDEGTI